MLVRIRSLFMQYLLDYTEPATYKSSSLSYASDLNGRWLLNEWIHSLMDDYTRSWSLGSGPDHRNLVGNP